MQLLAIAGMGALSEMRPSEVISLGLSLGAASLSAYVLVMTLQSGGGGGPGGKEQDEQDAVGSEHEVFLVRIPS